MNWFRENRWLGTFLILFGVCVLGALCFLFSAKGGFEAATVQFNEAAAERNRLEHLNPFPNEANYRKMKQDLAQYGTALDKLKDELRQQMPAIPSVAPNEFQSRLRQAMAEIADKARANRVKLPENFHLGFDEFTAALPSTAAAPLLAQELTQIQLLLRILIDAHVDALTAWKRVPLPEEKGAAGGAAPTPSPARRPTGPAAAGPKMLEGATVELTFTASPSAVRKVLNQVASSNQQFFIIRTLHVRNEQEKGPPREATGAVAGAPATTTPAPSGAIKFIVGNEHIETSTRIEIVRFTF